MLAEASSLPEPTLCRISRAASRGFGRALRSPAFFLGLWSGSAAAGLRAHHCYNCRIIPPAWYWSNLLTSWLSSLKQLLEISHHPLPRSLRGAAKYVSPSYPQRPYRTTLVTSRGGASAAVTPSNGTDGTKSLTSADDSLAFCAYYYYTPEENVTLRTL